jgi:hypothetical protein
MGGLVVCVSGDVGEIIGVSVCVRVLFAKEGGCQCRECSASLDTMGGLVCGYVVVVVVVVDVVVVGEEWLDARQSPQSGAWSSRCLHGRPAASR